MKNSKYSRTHTTLLHQRLGSLFPLSSVCNPYYKSAQEHEQYELDVGIFRPNQYKALCLPCTPSGLNAQTQIH
jgi:hypothetical protein